MSDGIVVFQNGLITFSNHAFKQILQNIVFQDDVEVDIYDYKIFSIYRQNDSVYSSKNKKNKNKKIYKNKLQNNEKYSLTDILSFPEEFLNDKIFKIVYDVDRSDTNNSNSLHYVILKVSKIKSTKDE